MTFWKRPRSLILTALIILGAWVIARQSREQAAAGQGAVTAWVQSAVRAAAADRSGPAGLGDDVPAVLADAFSEWVWSAQPAGIASDADVTVTSLRQELFGRGGAEATHHADISLRGKRAALTIVWDGVTARVVSFERMP